MHWLPPMGITEWLRCPIHTGCLPLVPCIWQRASLCPLGAPQIGVGAWRFQGWEVQGALGSLEVPRVEALGVLESLVVPGVVALEVPGVCVLGVPGWGFRGSPLTWRQLEAANR